MNHPQRYATRLFAQTIVLLALWALAALLTALKFLAPDDPLATAFGYAQAAPLTDALLTLAVFSGLLGAGLWMCAEYPPTDARLLRVGSALWAALVILAPLTGLFGLLEARAIVLPPLLALLLLLGLALLVAGVVRRARHAPLIQAWAVGMTLAGAGVAVSLIAPADPLHDAALGALAQGLLTGVGLPLAAVAVAFWLMHRFSNVTLGWAERGAFSAGGMVALAGALVSLPAALPAGAPEWVGTVGRVTLFAAPLLVAVFAAHAYRALTDRNASRTLTAQWVSLAVILFLLAFGLLGAAQALPGVRVLSSGTRLSDVQHTLMLFAAAAVVLGMVNQAGAEARGGAKITGFIPFWLVTFGLLGGGLALAAAGVVQVVVERQLSVGYLDTQTLLTPLYGGWAFGTGALALGLWIYTLSAVLRRPR
jgi:hypothetical protein